MSEGILITHVLAVSFPEEAAVLSHTRQDKERGKCSGGDLLDANGWCALASSWRGQHRTSHRNYSRARHSQRATQQWSGAADGNHRHDPSPRRFPRCWWATRSRSPSWIPERLFAATLLFLLDMVLPQLDAYHAGRHLQHLQPWASVELMQQQLRGQRGTNMHLTYQYEGYAGFHVLQLHTEGAPVLLFCAPNDLPQMTPRALCDAGRLGNMEANVMAGRALLGVLHLPDAQCRCVLLLVHEKVLHGGTTKTPEQRAFKRISPKYLDLSAVSLPIAKSFCGALLQRYLTKMAYLDPLRDWPKPIEHNMTIPIVLEDLVFLGDTRSRYELLVFAQANPARLPLAMGLVQPDIPARRMANDRKVQLTDALVRVLVRFLTPMTVETDLVHDSYYREYLLPLAAHGDGHVLAFTVAMLLAILTGRSDLCIAGVFGAGKTRSLAVLLIVLSCELTDFTAIVYTKENVAAKALADQLCDLAAPTLGRLGRLIGRIEEWKGAAYASQIDVRCSDRNRIISNRSILIATGGPPQLKWPWNTPHLGSGSLELG